MARRYVPKTYNNRRILRIISTGIITLALSFVILFLILFFFLQRYVVDGQLEIPWLLEETDETGEADKADGVGSEPDEPDEAEDNLE